MHLHRKFTTLLESSSILPAKPTNRHPLYLSSLDLFWRDIHYNLRLLFYRIPSDEYAHFVAKLKESLSAVLVQFFPLAGRLAKGEDGRFVIDCNDAGVEFVQATIDASFEDLGDSFDFKPYFGELAQWGHLTRSDRGDIPLLSVQVTRFLDGGVSIGVSHSHVAMDGYSIWHFMVSWGECSRGVPISKPPMHDRTVFKPKEELSYSIAAKLPFRLEPFLPPPTLFHQTVFHFSSQALTTLKRMATAPTTRRPPSSYEVLSAHCWQRVTAARQIPPQMPLSFVVLANWRWGRRGMPQPPISEAYFGNAVTWTNAYATATEILHEDLPRSVARIMDALDVCTSLDTLNGTIHWVELHDTRLGLDTLWFPGITMNVASSHRFPTYDVDFGWGIPSCVRPVRVGGQGGEICIFPCHPSGKGGIDVCIKLDPSSLERLQRDPLFLPSS